jgi:hypothetical protein
MGLLDEAIREHLELKRRRGADPGEIARQEGEAFGPIGHDTPAPAASPTAILESSPVIAQPEPADEGDMPEPEPTIAVPFETPSAPAEDEPGLGEEPAAGETTGQPTAEFAAHDIADALGGPEPVAEAAPPPAPAYESPVAPPPYEEREPPAAEPAVDPDVVPAEDDEDVLEETPEFLQETPEHDRLWFEQKPPKDFDF